MRSVFICLFMLFVVPNWARAQDAGKAAPPSLQLAENSKWGRSNIVRGRHQKGYVAFTFDDGPNPQTTPKVISALLQFHVPATFFVVGSHFAGENQENQQGVQLLKDMVQKGFSIGNHTTSHKNLSKQPTEVGKKHIGGNSNALKRVLGYQPRLFRPPFGVTTPAIRKYLRARGDTIVLWNIDPQDFRASSSRRGVAALRTKVVQKILAKSGGVVVMHDTKMATAKALPGILHDLQAANCQRLRKNQPPILPVSLSVFMKYRDARVSPTLEQDRSEIHSAMHTLWKHCNLNN